MAVVVSLPDQEWIAELGVLPGVDLVHWDLKAPPERDDIEVVIPPYMGSPTRLEQLANVPRLRAVQLVTAGYEHAVPYLPEGVVLANGAGIHDTSTAELALALSLASQRGIPDFVRAQETGQWLRYAGAPSLADRRVLVVGYGSIGRAIAKRLNASEAHVTAVASRARQGDDLVERVHGVDELPTLLPDAEVVILIVPLTERTRHLVDAEFLSALPDGALVVNVARGGVIDTDALLAECSAGRLRAALDVTDPEPLPAEHPLWRAPGVLISPHIGGASSAFVPRALAFLKRELTAYADGQGLSHVVHPS
ncbi:2-hydroxyacid dehydrogenase [Luteipulveratus mongoliensis]|uniref:Hydroxyacid dehydrogenase n=1 Tax=Luteipulveratus mongoliensis TaxID=571913 RepID=A0A0K1JQV0_9MICO|nr:2-hydroxyacid dehydrogenase [Luteipulveratus mongoliensis]AKU19099.1 hydroxyacid dehydrogenase [Luteipulveratus mongoliensis]